MSMLGLAGASRDTTIQEHCDGVRQVQDRVAVLPGFDVASHCPAPDRLATDVQELGELVRRHRAAWEPVRGQRLCGNVRDDSRSELRQLCRCPGDERHRGKRRRVVLGEANRDRLCAHATRSVVADTSLGEASASKKKAIAK